MMNALSGSPGMRIVEQAVEAAVLDEFRAIAQLGGVLAATELRYQRSQIQAAAHRYERQINEGVRPVIGLNRYRRAPGKGPAVAVVRTLRARKQLQVDRLERFKRRHRGQAEPALDRLAAVVERGGNVFAELIQTVEHCSLGQITGRLHEIVGRFRPMV
jgi:methylmalonyl-CoA mutase